MNKKYLVNWMIDLLSTQIGSGDFINWLPQTLRTKCRNNLQSRTLSIKETKSGAVLYITYSAKQWKQFAHIEKA